MTQFTFDVTGGTKIVRGKPSWPDCLCLEMSKNEALRRISELALTLKGTEEPETVIVCFQGALTHEED